MKFKKEFRLAHPETAGETDKQFELTNYKDWLEQQLTNNTSEYITLLGTLKEVQEFLGHIQPKIGEAAFKTIWDLVEESIDKVKK